jgi:hypothetical protein
VGLWAKAGKLPSVRTPGGMYLIPRDFVERMLTPPGVNFDAETGD